MCTELSVNSTAKDTQRATDTPRATDTQREKYMQRAKDTQRAKPTTQDTHNARHAHKETQKQRHPNTDTQRHRNRRRETVTREGRSTCVRRYREEHQALQNRTERLCCLASHVLVDSCIDEDRFHTSMQPTEKRVGTSLRVHGLCIVLASANVAARPPTLQFKMRPPSEQPRFAKLDKVSRTRAGRR